MKFALQINNAKFRSQARRDNLAYLCGFHDRIFDRNLFGFYVAWYSTQRTGIDDSVSLALWSKVLSADEDRDSAAL